MTTRPSALASLVLVVATVLAAVFVDSPAARASTPTPVDLAGAAPFGILGDAVPNTGLTTVNGDLGVSPGGAITGFPPGIVTGSTRVGGAAVSAAQSALSAAYADALGRTADTTLTGQDLGGLTLTPGVYRFGTTAQLTGALTLDGQNDPEAGFIFQIGTTLGSAAASSVTLVNGARACNVFWQVGTASTLGAATTFRGSMLASTAITVGAGSSIDGRLLTRAGTVTLDSDVVTPATCGSLSITSPLVGDFAVRGITGATQTTTAALEGFSVTDTRNSGAGWRVTAQASTFTSTARALAPGSVSMSAPEVTANGTPSPAPTVGAGPFVIDDAVASIASAAAGDGLGTYDFTATTLTLSLPPDVYAGAYASVVTISVVNAP